MSDLYTEKMLDLVLSGLLQQRIPGLEITRTSIDGTSPTHVTVRLTCPNGFGGQGSISLSLQLPTGAEGFLGFFHLLNLTLLGLTDSLSTSLTMVQNVLTGANVTPSVSIPGNTPISQPDSQSSIIESKTSTQMSEESSGTQLELFIAEPTTQPCCKSSTGPCRKSRRKSQASQDSH